MAEEQTYWVYILASGPHGTLYVGITNSLERRIAEHKAKEIKGFTATHGVDRLAYLRGFGDVHDAIHFEKQLKRWRRSWKVRLIEEDNPHWADRYLDSGRFITPSLSSRFRRQAKTGPIGLCRAELAWRRRRALPSAPSSMDPGLCAARKAGMTSFGEEGSAFTPPSADPR